MSEEIDKVESVRVAFARAFAPFAELDLDSATLDDAEAKIRELAELKIRHTGKKSEIAGTMKLIGRVAPEERASFGQLVQSVEKEIAGSIEAAELKLIAFVSNAKIEATGWHPAYPLEDGIRELVRGYRMIRNSKFSNV